MLFRRKAKGLLLSTALLLLANFSYAQEVNKHLEDEAGFYDISSVEIVEIQGFADPLGPIAPGADDDDGPVKPFPPVPTPPGGDDDDDTTSPFPPGGGTFPPGGGTFPRPNPFPGGGTFPGGGSIFRPTYGNQWLMIGQLVYQLVRENEPVANSDTERFSVMPIEANQWEKMEGWTGPHVRTFNLRAKNGFGMNVVNFQYQVILYANGSLEDKGSYVANLQIVPQFVDISWGFKFDSDVEVGDVMNMGTVEDPIVGVHMQIQWKIHSMLKHSQGIDSFFVRGDSEIQKIP